MSHSIPLRVAFLWHQHQPYYKNPQTGLYEMPWVRFHGTKDYLDMLLIMQEFPELRQTVNLVPSLLLQLEDYVRNDARDNVDVLSWIPADQLTVEQRQAILDNFFLANQKHMINPYPRYRELFLRHQDKARFLSPGEMVKSFGEQDFRDLQVWYNLTWIGQESRKRPAVARLFAKGRDFTEEDKQSLFRATREILSDIIPTHRRMWESGQLELTTSPFYHPILPLLIDQRVARESDPAIPLPQRLFRHPEDAEAQLERGLAYFADLFGHRPAGVWPSEGSVSRAAVELIARQGVRWIATDEGILARSLGADFAHPRIYAVYQWRGGSHPIHLFFRDHYLSDAIGFVYSQWEQERAIQDFLNRLHGVREKILADGGESALQQAVVSVILDGENCWEYYPQDGRPFLRGLFSALLEDPLVQTCTFSEALNVIQRCHEMKRIHPGSWINSNFNIWIGSEEDNRAWDLLKSTRDFLVRMEAEGGHDSTTLTRAWEYIFIAEGSDWCWWYGDEHSSAQDLEFDRLFRENLMQIYQLFKQEVPAELFQTIKQIHFDRFASLRPRGFITPKIDGKVTSFFEWLGAAVYEGRKMPQAAMHQVSRIIQTLYVGFDAQNLYLRIDFHTRPDAEAEFVVSVKVPHQLTVVMHPASGRMEKFEGHNSTFKRKKLRPTFQLGEVMEVAIPFAELKVKAGDRLGFQIRIKTNEQVLETFPHINIIQLEVPDEHYELQEWIV